MRWASLNTPERNALIARRVLIDGATLRAVGDEFSMSHVRVTQIIDKFVTMVLGIPREKDQIGPRKLQDIRRLVLSDYVERRGPDGNGPMLFKRDLAIAQADPADAVVPATGLWPKEGAL